MEPVHWPTMIIIAGTLWAIWIASLIRDNRRQKKAQENHNDLQR